MFVLSLNEKLPDSIIAKIEDCLFCKKIIPNSPLYLVIENPLHYKNQNIYINFERYKSIYTISNCKLKLNTALSNTLKKSTNEKSLDILIKEFQDTNFANKVIEEILNSKNFSLKLLLDIKRTLNEMLEKIYFTNSTFNTSLVIKEMRNELIKKSTFSYLDTLKLNILKTRANRFTLILIKNKIKEAINLINSNDIYNHNIRQLLDEKDFLLMYSNCNFSSIKNSDNNYKMVPSYPVVTALKFNSLDSFSTKKFSCNNNIKYLYLIKNDIVVSQVSYLDLLKETNGEAIVLNIFKNISEENLNIDYLSRDFLDEMKKYPELNQYFKANFIINNPTLKNYFSIYEDKNCNVPCTDSKNKLNILNLVNKSCETNFINASNI